MAADIMPGGLPARWPSVSICPSRIDSWVISHLLSHLCAGPSSRIARVDWCAVNISPHSINDQSFIDFLLQQLRHSPLPRGSSICLDLAEAAALSNVVAVRHFMEFVARAGLPLRRSTISVMAGRRSRILKHLSFDLSRSAAISPEGMPATRSTSPSSKRSTRSRRPCAARRWSRRSRATRSWPRCAIPGYHRLRSGLRHPAATTRSPSCSELRPRGAGCRPRRMLGRSASVAL